MSILSPRWAFSAGCVALMTACTTVAPQYSPVPGNIVQLREAGLEPMKIGDFKPADPTRTDALNRLSIRGMTYLSPYQGSFVEYLKQALTLEVQEANLLDPASTVVLAGFLVVNDLDANGFTKASAQMDARFKVTRAGTVAFDKVLSARFQWDSNILGMIAIPAARENYPVVVQQLLAKLYADPDFANALRK